MPQISKIPQQSWMILPETQKVMAALGDGEDMLFMPRFVGGAVRDTLVNRSVIDIDIATPLLPERVMEKLAAHDITAIPTGLQHGTITAVLNGKPFEITTLRRDIKTHGRHAEVNFTTDWRIDAERRDFTMNALYADKEGTVYDYFGGVADLREGRVRFVGDPAARIREDYLRILRYFRFHAHYGRGQPDAAALEACRQHAKLLVHLSAERVRQETLKLLLAENAADVWQQMIDTGCFTHILPEATNVAALKRLIDLEAAHHGGAFAIRRLAALLQTTQEGLIRITQLLRLSRAEAQQLTALSFAADTVGDHPDAAAIRRMVYHYGNDMALSLLLLTAARAGRDFEDLYEVTQSFRPPRFPLEGNDVLKMGVPAGPQVGEKLRAVEKWWINEDFAPGRTACLEKLRAV